MILSISNARFQTDKKSGFNSCALAIVFFTTSISLSTSINSIFILRFLITSPMYLSARFNTRLITSEWPDTNRFCTTVYTVSFKEKVAIIISLVPCNTSVSVSNTALE